MKSNPTSIFEFTDYRNFLREYLKYEVEVEKRSFRYLAKRAGLSSPNFLQRVLSGERNIKPTLADKIAVALGLNNSEKQYFCALVDYEDAEGELKQTILENLIKLARRAKSKYVQDETIHSSWLNYVLLELARMREPALTLDSATYALKGLATRAQIAEQFEFLVKKSYLVLDDSGCYANPDESVTFNSLNDARKIFDLQKCHLRYLDLAKLRISDALAQREYQGLTIAIPWEHFEVVKKKMRAFIFELNEALLELKEPDSVVRVQLCAFQIVKPSVESEDEEATPTDQLKKGA